MRQPVIRKHPIPGWWQVWIGGICHEIVVVIERADARAGQAVRLTLLRPDDVKPIVEAWLAQLPHDRAEGVVDTFRTALDTASAELAALRAEREAAIALLNDAEWSGVPEGECNLCPWCHQPACENHTHDCPAALVCGWVREGKTT